MKPGYATLITMLLLAGALTLHAPWWGVTVLAVLAAVTAVVDVARWRQTRTH